MVRIQDLTGKKKQNHHQGQRKRNATKHQIYIYISLIFHCYTYTIDISSHLYIIDIQYSHAMACHPSQQPAPTQPPGDMRSTTVEWPRAKKNPAMAERFCKVVNLPWHGPAAPLKT
jgi:hypothetical protein